MKIQKAPIKKARIEIIPMIDVIFFLLVFFMMTSLAMVQLDGKRVDLPESGTDTFNPQEKVVVSITREGGVFVGQEATPDAQILPLLASRVQENPEVTVIINCDKEQRIDRFQKVFDLIKQSNARNVMIATSPKTAVEAARAE